MKKLLALFCALLLTASLAACSDRGASSSSAASSEESSESGAPEQGETSGEARPSLELAAANNAQKNEEEITLVQLEEPKIGDTVATIETNYGNIKVILYPQYAEKAVENFTSLAEDGFYNGKVIHFVEEGYMIQGGAINSNGTGSKSVFTNANGEQEYFENEVSWDLWHFRGALSLASTSDGLNGSQFCIIQSDHIYGYNAQDLEEAGFPNKVIEVYENTGGTPHRDSYSTVFGMVYDTMHIVDYIAELETDASGSPIEPVQILSVTVEVLDADSDWAEADDNFVGAQAAEDEE